VRTEMERHEAASQAYEAAALQISRTRANRLFLVCCERSARTEARLIKTLVSHSAFDRGSLSPTYVKPLNVFATGSETVTHVSGIVCYPCPRNGPAMAPRAGLEPRATIRVRAEAANSIR
jgi:hypothetical protein